MTLVWLALAVPLAWRNRPVEVRSTLRGFLGAVALLSVICTLTVSAFFGTCIRYEAEFLPTLMLLAVTCVLGLERALTPTLDSGQTPRPLWRYTARWGWGLLLVFSLAFNLLVTVERCAEAHFNFGNVLRYRSMDAESIAQYEQALRLNPDYFEAHGNLGDALERKGKVDEAISQFQEAVRLKPDDGDAHYNLGNALAIKGSVDEAISQFQEAVRLKPEDAEAHNNLGIALVRIGCVDEAIDQFQEVVRLKPGLAEAKHNLAEAQARVVK